MPLYIKKASSTISISLLLLLLWYPAGIAKGGPSSRHTELLFSAYETAKKVYKAGDYAEAKTLFDRLRQMTAPTALAPYIHFYYALAAYHHGDKTTARQTFLELQTQFPNWSKQDEIHYWSAQCSFEAGDGAQALAALACIKDKHMAHSVLQMKKYFLKQIDHYETLQALIEQFPKDPLIKAILHKKAARQAYLTQDFGPLQRLKQQYNFSDYIYDPLKNLTSKQKTAYNVAVFLPFFVEELNYAACTDQFVIAVYQGIQLAIEKLAQEDIVINLFAFDTKRNIATTQSLLAQEAMPYMDLIIGPLYPDTIPLVAAFAKKHKINLVNPISDNPAVTQGNPFTFLFQPDLETCAQKAAALTLSDLHSKAIEEPCIGVFYGMEQKDVLQATLYKQKVEQQLGKPIDLFVQLSNATIKIFFEQATSQEDETSEVTEQDRLDLTKLTHIYVPSHDELLVSNVISLCLKLGIKPHIIGHEQWIKKEILNIHQLKKFPILFLSPHYIDYTRPALHAFRKNFFEQNGTEPNEKSYIGYEMMVFFGKMLGRYGTYFQKEWGNMHYNSLIFQGVGYGKHHSNQHIPVLRFAKDKFIVDALL
ncbi:MAG: tetratricopeptide repeat protein [Candidatus Cardinium sp.]